MSSDQTAGAPQDGAVATDAATPATEGAVVPSATGSVGDNGTGTVGVNGTGSVGDAGAGSGTGGKAAVADVEEAMKDVVDPELGINVVDLGLVYGVHVDDENVATLDMTLTSAACPLTDVIEDQARQALTTGPGGGLVNDIRINWVWLPPWGPDKITDEGRDQLRSLGFNV
ncbi:metal-sulfur cluster assembly factor [Micromonospora haikouensis]|uniref:metal-sulfur cluster assembly factor n=1 Tax=Micromonospora haikouensis TaxID=686309 RepID=UPI003D75BEC5